MAKVLTNKFVCLNRRFLSAAAEILRFPSAKAMTTIPDSSIVQSESPEEQSLWMRDPKTGYWIPEDLFGDIVVADLRDELLSKKQGQRRKTKNLVDSNELW